RTLDSPDLRTGLCIVLKRMDTGSAWIVANNPRSTFWKTPADGLFTGNRHLPLAHIVRASTAAPSFFEPELIEIAPGRRPHAAQQPVPPLADDRPRSGLRTELADRAGESSGRLRRDWVVSSHLEPG